MYRTADYPGLGARGGCGHRGMDWGDLWRWMTGGGAAAGRGGRRHGGPFPFGPGGFPFGPGGPWGGRRGPKARRGDVRMAALLLLAEEPRNGYQIMQELETRTRGAWRPSPGSVYPALQQLEDEGLVRSTERDGRRRYELTDAGRRVVDERDPDAPTPWEQMTDDVSDDAWGLMNTGREVAMAMLQVMQTGTEAQRREAQRILVGARRDLYRLLADGGPDEREEADGGPSAGA